MQRDRFVALTAQISHLGMRLRCLILGGSHVGLESQRVGFANSQVGIRIHHVKRRQGGTVDARHVGCNLRGVIGSGGAVGGQEDVLEHGGVTFFFRVGKTGADSS